MVLTVIRIRSGSDWNQLYACSLTKTGMRVKSILLKNSNILADNKATREANSIVGENVFK